MTALGTVATFSSGQQIRWTIDGTEQPPINSGADVTVSLGTVSTTRLVRFWDPTPDPVTLLPNDDLGKIVVQGSLTTNGEVQVLLAPPTEAWPPSSGQPILATALRHFGIDASDGIEVTNAALREKTRLAGFVSGDVRGSIVVGQVQRLQVGADPVVPNPGIIYANLTAVAPWPTPFEGSPDSIAFVSAGNGIRGTIKAEPVGIGGSIGRVIVGPSALAEGIRGNVLAETGFIRRIYTTGPIGTATVRSQIRAGDGIDEIRVFDEAAGTLLDRDVNADIAANLNYAAGQPLDPPQEAVIQRVETLGDISGTIRAGNLTFETSQNSVSRFGIISGGVISADISVDLAIHNADIIARSITGKVSVGIYAKGSIVATDPVNGRIEDVEIGLRDRSTYPPGWDQLVEIAGFVGNTCKPFDAFSEQDWRTPPASVPCSPTFCCPFDGGSRDSVIRAKSIGTVAISAMTVTFAAGSIQAYVPRIESPLIERLKVDDFREGVVWSGQLEYDSNGGIANDPTNDFSVIPRPVSRVL